MDHKTLAAVATTTDRGEFTAIAAAYSVDRVNDQIIPGAFAGTIKRWQESGKRIPLHWNHSGAASDIIGSIDPSQMKEVGEGLQVAGNLDLTDSETAREAWRSMKNGAMSLSFGYLATKTRKAKGGVLELLEIDLFEVSIVPSPANADTRVLAMKSADAVVVDNTFATLLTADDFMRNLEALQAHEKAAAQELQEIKDRLAQTEQALADLKEKSVEAADPKPETARSADPLRRQADDIALKYASGGLSLEKPPTPVAPKPRTDLVQLDELKQRMRDDMLIHLNGDIEP